MEVCPVINMIEQILQQKNSFKEEVVNEKLKNKNSGQSRQSSFRAFKTRAFKKSEASPQDTSVSTDDQRGCFVDWGNY